jgi:beta-exotoxin I transport system permease protein
MPRSVFGRVVWDRRPGLVWWIGGLVFLAMVMVASYPSVRSNAESLTSLLDSMPKGLVSLFGSEDPAEFVRPAGYVDSRLYSSIGTLIAIFFAISIGAGAIAGQEEEGTLELLATQPVSRRRLVLESWLALMCLTSFLGLALVVVLTVANPLVDLHFGVEGILAANVGMVLIAVLFGSVALAAGAATGHRARAVGAAAGLAIVGFFVNGLAPLLGGGRWIQNLSPFHWYLAQSPLSGGFAAGFLLLALGVAVAVAIAVWGFRRRDLRI